MGMGSVDGARRSGKEEGKGVQHAYLTHHEP